MYSVADDIRLQTVRTAVKACQAAITRTVATIGMLFPFLGLLPAKAQELKWNHTILWISNEKIQGVALGDADPDRKGVEGVAVSLSGAVGIGGLSGSATWSEVILL